MDDNFYIAKPFCIIIKSDRKPHRMLVTQVFLNNRIERLKISGRDRSIVIEGNRPLVRNLGLKHKRIEWKIVEGQMYNRTGFDSVILQIEQVIEWMDKI